jgi:hypothetical protein
MTKPPPSKWPDYLFTLGVRAFFGSLFGPIAVMLLLFGTHRSPTLWMRKDVLIVFLIACAAGIIGGALWGILTVPDWQTPWYKSEYQIEREAREAQKSADSEEK